MNDEQTTCDACGRMELRGTVIVADQDANEVGRYGTTCVSKLLGVKLTRRDAVNREAVRRQAVVHLIRQARYAASQGDAPAVSMNLRELDRFYVLHRADEQRAVAELVAGLPECWRVLHAA